MTGFFVMEKLQENYDELKKKSELTEKFIRLVDKIEIAEYDIPKTEKGMETKAKELIDKINKKMEKLESEEPKKSRKTRELKPKKEKRSKKF